MSRTQWRVALSGAVISSLLLAGPVAASATEPADADPVTADTATEPEDADPVATDPVAADAATAEPNTSAGSSNEVLQELIAGSSQFTGSTGSSIDAALSSMSRLGSSELSFEGPLLSSEDGYPLPTDSSIREVELRQVTNDPRAERLERWEIASPSMKRVIEVQVMRAADPTADAPMLYLLDGIGGNKVSSGWVNDGAAERVFADEDVTVVMPLGAAASMYSDWKKPDPALGTMMWETFITEELAPLLEADESLNFNGKRGIGGLSMGAAGAVHLANSNPEFFAGVIGISGCYSTMDRLGRTTSQLIVGSRGGDVSNMWGPFGSETWREHDVSENPEGLRDMAVYLSAANGAIGEADQGIYLNDPFYNMIAGVVLERGVHDCTRKLDSAMVGAGMTHQKVEYLDSGAHNWANYNTQLQPGWDEIKEALY